MLAWLQMIGWVIFAGLFFYSMRRPRLLRMAIGLWRRRWPISRSSFTAYGATYLVMRADDTKEVLERSQEFLLGPVNERKILTGDFVIALDPERRYVRERANMTHALPPDRLQRLEGIVDAEAVIRLEEPIVGIVDAALFAEHVTVAIVHRFWGLDPWRAKSAVVAAEPGIETMRLWLRKLAIVLGSMDPAPFGIREIGLQCSEELLSYVRAECETHSKDSPDMIAYLLARNHGDMNETVRSIAGLIMTGAAVVTKGFCHAFDQLLQHKEALDAALDATFEEARCRTARDVPAARVQRIRLGRILVEALRFNPVFPVLPRYCVRPTTLARGTPREREIPAGSNVIVSPLGAMFDPEAMVDPERFGLDRNIQLNPRSATGNWEYGNQTDGTMGDYMLFGGGEHWCLGEQMAIAEMASMGFALLDRLSRPLPGARRRRPCRERGVRYDGSAAASLLVTSR